MQIRNKIIIINLFVIISIFIIVYFIVIPSVKEINKIHAAIASEEKELQVKLERGMLIKKINEDFEKIKEDREQLNAIFIDPGQEVAFIEKLEHIIKNYNLEQKIRLVDFGGKTRSDEFKKNLTLNINLAGDFIQMLKYINDVEKLNTYFNINSVTIEGSEPETGVVNAVIEGDSYSLAEPE